jgi:hypothetical protein
VTAVLEGAWPADVPDALREHINTCACCRDVIELAIAIRDEPSADTTAPVPGAGLVWWRAELRLRQEAARAAARPLFAATALALAVVAGGIAALVQTALPRLAREWTSAVGVAGITSSSLLTAALVLTALVVTPVAVYLALSDE